MIYSGKYSGCKVFIHADREDKLSIDTTIIEYNSVKMVVIVKGDLPQLKENEKVSLLLLLKQSALEFQGVVRKTDSGGNREITLFKGHEKEEREDTRYDVNVQGIIDGLVMGENILALNPSINALVVNISKGGILVRMKAGVLNKGTSFRIKIETSDAAPVLQAKVMRMRVLEEQEVDYGCVLTGKV